ncbi:hypothetical protein E2320_019994 [Naja naja]|nr:hypothetical protein E2320_019994 [Naja naja]
MLAEAAQPSSSSRLARPGSNRLKVAAAACLNHQKKKLYVQGLETHLQGLAAKNQQLCDCNRGLCRRLHDLEWETGYSRAMLAKQNTLGCLLGCLAGDRAGSLGLCMRISTSLFQSTVAGAFREIANHDYALPILAEKPEEKLPPLLSSASPGGIFLHVDRTTFRWSFAISAPSGRPARRLCRPLLLPHLLFLLLLLLPPCSPKFFLLGACPARLHCVGVKRTVVYHLAT